MVLVDNNVLSSLAKVERLHLLPELFDQVCTVPSVIEEFHHDAVKEADFVKRIDGVKRYRGGWLGVLSPTEEELKLTEDRLDPSLSFTDAECVALAEKRGLRLLTDDRLLAEKASRVGVEFWDLKLLLEACIVKELIPDEEALRAFIEGLQEKDGYRFTEEDEGDLLNRLQT